MGSKTAPRFCLVPRLSGVGGMVSFQHKLAAGLVARGFGVGYDPTDFPYAALLLIGGTRRLGDLWRARRRGIPVVQRLDGMNWMHRFRSARAGLRHFLRAEVGNWILALIRSRLADRIVYQSEFSRCWWEHVYGPVPAPARVVYNGVDLDAYTPAGPHQRPVDHLRLLLVEGSLLGGYELGLHTAVGLARELARQAGRLGIPSFDRSCDEPVELVVVGRVARQTQARWQSQLASLEAGGVRLSWSGLVPRAQIPEIDRSAHLLFSADLNPACPNSVVEALACGLPVVAFDTGALPELVMGDAGRVVPYGGDPWKLDPPDIPALAQAALEILQGGDRFRRAARLRAEAAFSLDAMVDAYLEVLLDHGS